MPIELYDANQSKNETGPSATIHLDFTRHWLVVDTYLKDFSTAIDAIGVLQKTIRSDRPEHKRYVIEVNREISMEKAAEVVEMVLSELIKTGDTWDIWK